MAAEIVAVAGLRKSFDHMGRVLEVLRGIDLVVEAAEVGEKEVQADRRPSGRGPR